MKKKEVEGNEMDGFGANKKGSFFHYCWRFMLHETYKVRNEKLASKIVQSYRSALDFF